MFRHFSLAASENKLASTDQLKERVRAALGRLASVLPGYRVREAQLQMMMTVVDVLSRSRLDKEDPSDGQNIGVIEAPTGTGKSIASTLPAIIVAKEQKRKVVISTATVALQEQLLKMDLPLLNKILPEPVTYTQAKGRGRYACTAMAARHATGDGLQTDLFGETGTLGFRPTDTETEAISKLSQSLMDRSWDGDKDALPDAVSDRVWVALTIDRNACTGRNCRFVRQCPYLHAREKIQRSDIIVANHDLLLADLKLGGGKLLPSPEESLIILDESHNLPAKAVNAFSSQHTLIGMQKILSRIPRVVSRCLPSLSPRPAAFAQRIEASADNIARLFDDLMATFEHSPKFLKRDKTSQALPSLRFAHGLLPVELADVAQSIYRDADALLANLVEIREEIDAANRESPSDVLAALIAEVGVVLTKIEAVVETWGSMLYQPEGRSVPVAKWVSLVGFQKGYDYSINVASISAAEKLSGLLWKKACGVILTSATLTAAGEFRMILRRTGLFKFPEVTTLKLASPFDYQKNAVLVIPKLDSDPKDTEGHTREIVRLLPLIIQDNGEGTLVLFASRRQMETVYAGLTPLLQSMILMQGKTLSKSEILNKHCRRIDKKKTSVIFGLESFSEGVNLVGKACSHVVIAKIPFAAPVDPIEEATAEWLEKIGGNPFLDLSVPSACIKVVQGAGRLLRTETDTGRVTILDKRLTTKRYGQAILRSLPPFKVIDESR